MTAGGPPLGSIIVRQGTSPVNTSPETNDRPWALLGVFNVTVGDTIEVELSGADTTIVSGDVLCAGDVMIHPLWVTVTSRAVGVTVNPLVPTANAGDYLDWVDAYQGFGVPVEGSGNRLQLNVSATIDPLYSSAPDWDCEAWDWSTEMASVHGVYFFADSDRATAWAGGAITPGTTYTSTVWVSTNPSSLPANPFTIAFEADAPPGPGDAEVNSQKSAATVPAGGNTNIVTGQGISAWPVTTGTASKWDRLDFSMPNGQIGPYAAGAQGWVAEYNKSVLPQINITPNKVTLANTNPPVTFPTSRSQGLDDYDVYLWNYPDIVPSYKAARSVRNQFHVYRQPKGPIPFHDL